jgi:CheY-like chemotaxis protein
MIQSGTKVLLVDDDPGIAWGVGRYLTNNGFTVSVCGDGVEAIRVLEEETFDEVVTDVQMPRLNGLAVVEWVHRHRPQTVVIVITAFGSTAVRQASLQKGAIHYLEKPVDPHLLRDLLVSAREQKRFFGNVSDVDLFDYIQMLLISRRTLIVEVISREGERGQLYLRDGDVVHAECSGLSGEQAFCHCLAFAGGSFSSFPWRDPSRNTITRKGESLLLDAARQKDETTRISTQRIAERLSRSPRRSVVEDIDIDFDLNDSNREETR